MNPKKYCCADYEHCNQKTLDDCRASMKELQRDWNYIKRMDLLSETKETVLAEIQDKFDELKKEMVEIVNSLKLEV